MIYTSSERQTNKVLFLLGEILKPQSDGNPWKLKYFGFVLTDDEDDCDLLMLIFVDKGNHMIYYTVNRDGTHSYKNLGAL